MTDCPSCDHASHDGECPSCGCRPGIAWRCWKGKCGEAYEQGGYGVTCTHQPATTGKRYGSLEEWLADLPKRNAARAARARDWRSLVASHVCTEQCQVELVTEYYCPTHDRVMSCPGPCPDGREHEPLTVERMIHHA